MFAFLSILFAVCLAAFTQHFFAYKKAKSPTMKPLFLMIGAGILSLIFMFMDPHKVLAVLLLLSGTIAFIIFFIILIVKAIKQQPLKKIGMVMLATFLVLVMATSAMANYDSSDTPSVTDEQGNDVAQGPDNQPPYVPDQPSDPGQDSEPDDSSSGGDIPDDSEPANDGESTTPDTEEPQGPEQPDQAGDAPDEEPEEPTQPAQPAEDPEEPKETLSGTVKVHYIDVGQGDAILIQAPDKTVLIDGGPRSAGPTVVSYLSKQGVKTLDLIISTHPHEDHIGGLITVLGSLAVEEVIDPGIAHTSQTFEDYIDLIDARDAIYTEATPGITRDLGGTAQLQVIGPKSPSSSDLNNASVVVRLTFGDTSFLFTGDAESAAETQLLNSGYTLTSTVLKIGHHGSETSTSQAFLNRVKPTFAIISCGAGNSYEHPRQATLDKLKAANINTYRTDTHGNITVTTDGDRVTVKAAKSPSSTVVFTGADTGTEDPGGDDEEEPPATDPGDDEGQYVGSKEAKKYHYPSCRYVKNILPENIVWFADFQEALDADFIPCGVCKPPSQ